MPAGKARAIAPNSQGKWAKVGWSAVFRGPNQGFEAKAVRMPSVRLKNRELRTGATYLDCVGKGKIGYLSCLRLLNSVYDCRPISSCDCPAGKAPEATILKQTALFPPMHKNAPHKLNRAESVTPAV